MPCFAQGVAGSGSAPVLPDDCARERLHRLAIPRHHGFALVGDPDGGDGLHVAICKNTPDAIERCLPYFVGIVLDPAGPGEMLRDLGLGGARDRAVAPKQHRAGGRGPCIDHKDMFAHGNPLVFS